MKLELKYVFSWIDFEQFCSEKSCIILVHIKKTSLEEKYLLNQQLL